MHELPRLRRPTGNGLVAVAGVALLIATVLVAANIGTSSSALAQTGEEPAAGDEAEAAPSPPAAVAEVLDELVAEGTITRAQADAIVERFAEQAPRFGHRRGFHGRGFGAGAGLDTVAAAIGIEPEVVMEGLRTGQSFAEIATANGSTADAVVDAIVAEATEKIEEAVAADRLDEETAAEKLADLEEHVTALVNGERPAGDGFGHGRRGRGHGPGGFGRGRLGPPSEDAVDAVFRITS
jgi:hypothetical protein